MINMLLFILLVIVSVYISYKISQGSRENFDDGTPVKVVGTTTLLNGKNKNTAPSASPATVKVEQTQSGVSNTKLLTTVVKASEENNNETEQPYTSSPASISDSTKKIIPTQVSEPVSLSVPSASPSSHRFPADPSDLSPKEKQLFDAFLEKRITDEKVQELIESGILNEKLVEKFLSMIDDLPEGSPVTHAPQKLSSITPATQKDANLLEGFCGSSGIYARANNF